MPTVAASYVALAERLAERLGSPRIRALHLPSAHADCRAGMPSSVRWSSRTARSAFPMRCSRLPNRRCARTRTPARSPGWRRWCSRAAFAGKDPAAKALGFAAVNALSQHLFSRARWLPTAAGDSLGEIEPKRGEHIGMIGLFRPLVAPCQRGWRTADRPGTQAGAGRRARGLSSHARPRRPGFLRQGGQHLLRDAQRHAGRRARRVPPCAVLRDGRPDRRLSRRPVVRPGRRCDRRPARGRSDRIPRSLSQRREVGTLRHEVRDHATGPIPASMRCWTGQAEQRPQVPPTMPSPGPRGTAGWHLETRRGARYAASPLFGLMRYFAPVARRP